MGEPRAVYDSSIAPSILWTHVSIIERHAEGMQCVPRFSFPVNAELPKGEISIPLAAGCMTKVSVDSSGSVRPWNPTSLCSSVRGNFKSLMLTHSSN